MASIHFLIGIIDTSVDSHTITSTAISVVMPNKMTHDEFTQMMKLFEDDAQDQFIHDVQMGEHDTPEFDRIVFKIQALSAILPDAEINMDRNFAHYGANVSYYEFDSPTLIFQVGEYKKVLTNLIYPNNFQTDLYTLLVQNEKQNIWQ